MTKKKEAKIEKIAMTEDEAWEWWRIRNQFINKSIQIEGNSVFSVHFHQELVEEDEKYQYEGKIDDTAPGIRYERLGSLEEYARYLTLKEKMPPTDEWYKENREKYAEKKMKEMRGMGDRYWWV